MPHNTHAGRFFKGWAVPGPETPHSIETIQQEAAQLELEIHEPVSVDALCGNFKILQLKNGHRFSTDDLLVAWFSSQWSPRFDRILELGCGIGTITLSLAWKHPGARFTSIEAQRVSATLAKKNFWINGIEERIQFLEGDLRQITHQIPKEGFDLVVGSPPYFALSDGIVSEHSQKVACRFEVRGDVADYCSAASNALAPGGMFVFVFPRDPEYQRQRALQGIEKAGLKLLISRPIILKEGNAPLLELFAAVRAGDFAPNQVGSPECLDPLLIRRSDGTVDPEYLAVKQSLGFRP